MECPSCHKPVSSFFRFIFTLQGVELAKAMKGYLKCQSCGTLLRTTSYNLIIISQIVLGVFAVVIYILLFPSVVSWVGYKTAVGLFFPFILIVGLIGISALSWKFAKAVVVEEKIEVKD